MKIEGDKVVIRCRVRSESDPKVLYGLVYYEKEGWICGCIAGIYRHPCDHKQTAQKHYLEEAKQNFNVK